LEGIKEMKAQEVIENVVSQIVAELERGTMPWCKPWTSKEGAILGGFALPLRVTGEAYRGINILALWSAAQTFGYRSRYWMTFKQAEALKAHVRKGEMATGIIYADKVTKEDTTAEGETVEKSYAFLKAYAVFNADQIEGLPEKFYAKEGEQVLTPAPAETLEIPGKEWLANIPAVIRHGGGRAYFSPAADFVQMPAPQDFKTPLSYTSTLIHELTHWTGHKSRLDRLAFKKWGDEAYAFEELVAELGAAFGCAHLGFVPAIREDHAPYIAGWIKQLKNDPRALVNAAAQASKALDYLDAFQASSDMREAA
jgi:antirestriction protein ArdC